MCIDLSALNVKRLRIRSIESQRTRGRCPAILASEKCFRKADARSATGKDSGGDGNREIYLSVPSATLSDLQGEEDDMFLESISSPLPRPLFGHDLHGDTRQALREITTERGSEHSLPAGRGRGDDIYGTVARALATETVRSRTSL